MTTAIENNKSYGGIEYTLFAQFVPFKDEHWEDQEQKISSMNCEVPIYVMKREDPHQVEISLEDDGKNADA